MGLACSLPNGAPTALKWSILPDLVSSSSRAAMTVLGVVFGRVVGDVFCSDRCLKVGGAETVDFSFLLSWGHRVPTVSGRVLGRALLGSPFVVEEGLVIWLGLSVSLCSLHQVMGRRVEAWSFLLAAGRVSFYDHGTQSY
ncbi:amino acid adenylation enzyme/thioester reductasefamily protein [Striga asiatica]|uniref:Amino acid adenylation enzyme/thioester reductasefamily protein n=1 Tax=Striga asiatica TaxID=4170 RepID=A0A5A7R5L3_STRAF|nr:amino acid adenylation enzyme/thioester reductasefamily protein [Striga asiatica]